MLSGEETKQLVQERIGGLRIGCEVPNYIHSFRVYDALQRFGFSQEVCLAGLLHDIIEDSDTTMEELEQLGYSAEVLRLVDLATHDPTVTESYERRQRMLERIILADDRDARAVKIADISDNLTEVHLLKRPENTHRFLEAKCPVFIYYGNKHFGGTPFFDEFIGRYFHQVKQRHKYFA